MALTAAEITDFRKVVGDDELPYILDDTQAEAMSVKAGRNYALTCVYWLRRILGARAKLAQENSIVAGTSTNYSNLFTQTEKLLAYWQKQYESNSGTGLGEGTTVTGDVNTDPDPAPEGMGLFDLDTTHDYPEDERAAGWYT